MVLGVSVGDVQARTWTSRSGSSVEAELTGVSETHAELTADLKTRSYAIDFFSAKDQSSLRRRYREQRADDLAQELSETISSTLEDLESSRAEESARADAMIQEARQEDAEKKQRKAARAARKRAKSSSCGSCRR